MSKRRSASRRAAKPLSREEHAKEEVVELMKEWLEAIKRSPKAELERIKGLLGAYERCSVVEFMLKQIDTAIGKSATA